MDTNKELGELVRRNETNYISGITTISKYVEFDLAENINKIDAYINSKHISGPQDSMGRDKPFFNIVTAAINIWYRATDIDRKHIKVKANKSTDTIASFLATVHLQNWMRKVNYGAFLNEWGRSLARYGSSVVKHIESDGTLYPMVIPWNRLIVDPIDFDNDAVIEVLELTPAQLKMKKGYDQEIVDKLLEARTARETLGKQRKDTKSNFIKLYEVHGKLPLSYLTGKEKDEDEYVQQMHVISFVAGRERGKFDDFCLIKGREAKNPYMITHLIKEDGRTQSIGAVENLFESQWMVNHTAKQIKDQLDLASKLIFQTSDGNFVGQNALNAIETGDILIHNGNELTQVQNDSHDITSLQAYGAQWKALGSEINGISEAMMGQNAPSGTAWRAVEAQLEESHSLFEVMTENKGLHIEEMLRTYVIPHLKRKMDTADEIGATLEDHDIQKIDAKYVPYEATKRLAKKLINQILATREIPKLDGTEMEGEMMAVEGELDEQGQQRFFKPDDIPDVVWKEIFKDLEWELEVDITGEQRQNANDMSTLAQVFQTLAGLQGQPLSPEAKMLLNKILTLTGTVSPAELSSMKSNNQATPQGGVGVGAGLEKLAVNEQPQ